MIQTMRSGTSVSATRPVPAVLAIVTHGDSVLLVQRKNPPDAGRWGFPGGKIEPGETVTRAAERELQEETGLDATAEHILTAFDVLDRDAHGELRYHYVLVAVVCRDPAGTLAAASDAADARWFRLDEIEHPELPTSARVMELARQAMADS